MGCGMEVGVFVNAGVVPVVGPAVGSKPGLHRLGSTTGDSVAVHQQGKSVVGDFALGFGRINLSQHGAYCFGLEFSDRILGERAVSLGRGAIHHVFATITTDAHIALFGMTHESLKHAEP